jgi:hypothetical protein
MVGVKAGINAGEAMDESGEPLRVGRALVIPRTCVEEFLEWESTVKAGYGPCLRA